MKTIPSATAGEELTWLLMETFHFFVPVVASRP
jgi:hypothetical protein